jgi:glycosyltransferase involved in cell wall biosynthesis
MWRLARTNRVLFVESLGLRRPQFARRDLRRIVRRLARGLGPPRAVDGLHVLSPLVLPLHDRAWARALNARLLRGQVSRAARRLGLRRPLLWSYVPQAAALVGALDPSQVVYHCVDDIAEQKGVEAAPFRSAETHFAAAADLVLASAPALARRMRELNPRVLDAPNVADTARFAQALEPGEVDPALAALPRPRIVFTGAIVATKLDLELLAALATARPEWTFALVGPVGAGDPGTDVSALAAAPNVHLLGPRRYGELPRILRGADAGIIPYAINDLTRSVFPMKVYEYLSAGLPVVSTPLPALEGLGEIAFARDAGEAESRLAALLAGDGSSLRLARSEAARAHSWDRRLEEIAAALEAAPRR